MQFWGQYEFTLDDRGRVSVPAHFREQFGVRAVLTLSADGCIEAYTEAGFSKMSDQVAALPRTTSEGRQSRRDFYGQTFQADLDRQGRILIPSALRQSAALEGPVIIMGSLECLEIWNPGRLRGLGNDGNASPAERDRG